MFLIGDVQATFYKELTMLHTEPRVLCEHTPSGQRALSLNMPYAAVAKTILLHSSGKTTQIMFDTKSRSTIEIPQWLREEINDFED